MENGAEVLIKLVLPVSICMLTVVIATNATQFSSFSFLTFKITIPYIRCNSAPQVCITLISVGLFLTCAIVTTFIFLLLYKCYCYKILYIWLMLTSFVLLFVFVFVYVGDILRTYNIPIDYITILFLLWNFSIVGLVSIYWKAPLVIQQAFLILSSSLIAISFVVHLPEWTVWLLLAVMAIWDLLAVLCPKGPLKMLIETSQQRNEPFLPGLLFTSGSLSCLSKSKKLKTAKNKKSFNMESDDKGAEVSNRIHLCSSICATLNCSTSKPNSTDVEKTESISMLPLESMSKSFPDVTQTPPSPHDFKKPRKLVSCDSLSLTANQTSCEINNDDPKIKFKTSSNECLNNPCKLKMSVEATEEYQYNETNLSIANILVQHYSPRLNHRSIAFHVEEEILDIETLARRNIEQSDNTNLPENETLLKEVNKKSTVVKTLSQTNEEPTISQMCAAVNVIEQENLRLMPRTEDFNRIESLDTEQSMERNFSYNRSNETSCKVKRKSRLKYLLKKRVTRLKRSLTAKCCHNVEKSDKTFTKISADIETNNEAAIPAEGLENKESQPAVSAEEVHDDGVKLGLGDFIFYSVLVGKASYTTNFITALACAISIIIGLCFTMFLLIVYQRPLPALPISIAFGLLCYFPTAYMTTPFLLKLHNKQLFI